MKGMVMLKPRLCFAVVAAVMAFCVWSPRADGAGGRPAAAQRLLIVLDAQADDTDLRIAEVLKARIERRCAATASIVRAADGPQTLRSIWAPRATKALWTIFAPPGV